MADIFDQFEHHERESISDENAFTTSSSEESVGMEVSSAQYDSDGAMDEHDDSRNDESEAAERPRVRRASTRKPAAKRNAASGINGPAIIHLSDHAAKRDRQQAVPGTEPDDDAGEPSATIEALDDLLAQGFTADEAIRLIGVSDRLAHGVEARESESTLRRLRFTRWLIEHGILNEFTA